MNAFRGHVRDGHVEVDASLPDGAEVVVLVAGNDEPFDLDDPSIAELEDRIAEAERGDVEPAQRVFDRLRAKR